MARFFNYDQISLLVIVQFRFSGSTSISWNLSISYFQICWPEIIYTILCIYLISSSSSISLKSFIILLIFIFSLACLINFKRNIFKTPNIGFVDLLYGIFTFLFIHFCFIFITSFALFYIAVFPLNFIC